jgi:hypothetical protein
MNAGNLTAGAGAMRQALQLLRLRWAEAKSQWNDPVSQEFEEKYILELERACQDAVEHIGRLAHVFGKCYQECSRRRFEE